MSFDYAAHGLREPDRRPEIPGGPQSVADVLDRALAEAPDREALVGRSGRYSARELDRAANRAANALRELGIREGDRVAACLPNDVDIVIAFLGTQRIGALWVGVNRPLALPEKTYLLNDCGAAVFLAPPEIAAEVSGRAEDLPGLRRVIEVAANASPGGWRSLQEAASDARPDVAIDPFAPAAIAYTSGTTGFPKGAVHSQHNLLIPGAVSRARGEFSQETRQGCVLPLTILNLIVLSPLVAFQVGSCCVPMDRIDAPGIAEWVRDERVGHFAGVPTIFHDLLTHPEIDPADLASLIAPQVGGAECPEETRALYRERFGSEVRIGYGMTEAPTAVTASDGAGSPQPGLCGRALPQVEIEIRDERDRVLPAGEIGEICVAPATSGPWAGIYTPMLGYWGKPHATAEALRGGVYHSGDLGLMEDDGNVFIRGRRNELILRGGANVYPAEVERVINEDPRVADCAVFGTPDARLGERVVAAVELEEGATLEPEEIAARCREQLARYKVPERIRVVKSLPRNAMSKVVKRKLASLFET